MFFEPIAVAVVKRFQDSKGVRIGPFGGGIGPTLMERNRCLDTGLMSSGFNRSTAAQHR